MIVSSNVNVSSCPTIKKSYPETPPPKKSHFWRSNHHSWILSPNHLFFLSLPLFSNKYHFKEFLCNLMISATKGIFYFLFLKKADLEAHHSPILSPCIKWGYWKRVWNNVSHLSYKTSTHLIKRWHVMKWLIENDNCKGF